MTVSKQQNTPLIKTVHLEKVYDMGEVKVHALRDVSFELIKGQFVAIMGPSGSGKSTFMNMLGCLDKPTGGEYYLDGTNVATFSKDELADIRNTKIGFVFQSFNLLPRTTLLENVELPLHYRRDRRITQKEKDEKALAALDSVGLKERAYSMPQQLSGGQQQRVAIARALINDPPLLLGDEPTGNLDSRTSVEIMRIFQTMNRVNHITVMIVTHSEEVSMYADRIVRFRDGRIQEDYMVENPVNAEEALKNWPQEEDD